MIPALEMELTWVEQVWRENQDALDGSHIKFEMPLYIQVDMTSWQSSVVDQPRENDKFGCLWQGKNHRSGDKRNGASIQLAHSIG